MRASLCKITFRILVFGVFYVLFLISGCKSFEASRVYPEDLLVFNGLVVDNISPNSCDANTGIEVYTESVIQHGIVLRSQEGL